MAKKKESIEDRLIRSMGQALEIAKGKMAPSRAYDLPLTAKQAAVAEAPAYGASEVVAIRTKLRLSQTVFAQALNVSPGTVRSWEQGEKPPAGSARRLLQIVDRSPEAILGGIVIVTGRKGRAVGSSKRKSAGRAVGKASKGTSVARAAASRRA